MKQTFKTKETIFTPYHDVWNANAYVRREPFCEQPWQTQLGDWATLIVTDDLPSQVDSVTFGVWEDNRTSRDQTVPAMESNGVFFRWSRKN